MPKASPPASNPLASCQQCGAQRQAGAKFCWLCGAPQPASPAPRTTETPLMAEVVAEPTDRPRDVNPWVLHSSIWAALAAVLALGYGLLYANEPILATIFAVAVVPAFLLTVLLSALGRAAGKPWDPVKKLLGFLSVFGLTIALGAVAAVLLVVALTIGL